ncbi:MAG: hypothetical protein IJ629_04330 [Clostridia bacterium]|nr:hypothetical protein [Clostridia bacterium]
MIDNEDYMNKVKYQIELDKLLHSIKPEKHEEAKSLFEQKRVIMQKNGLFADWQLRRLNKKLEKLKI